MPKHYAMFKTPERYRGAIASKFTAEAIFYHIGLYEEFKFSNVFYNGKCLILELKIKREDELSFFMLKHGHNIFRVICTTPENNHWVDVKTGLTTFKEFSW